MPDVLLFGATGYTGGLTARALADRGVDFAVAGRDRSRLEAVAEQTGASDVRIAQAGDTGSLAGALAGCRVLLTCVGPFVRLGDTAVEAALRARVHYVDSTGEGTFIDRLETRYGRRARETEVTLAPAMGFDEAPADLAGHLATEGMTRADLTLTYAVPSTAAPGTVRSALGILASEAPFLDGGRRVLVGTGALERWAPMPPPLGPRRSVSAPLAELNLAPLHLNLDRLSVYMTTGNLQRWGLRWGLPVLRVALKARGVGDALTGVLAKLIPRPDSAAARAKRWTILAEARAGERWRNVVASGTDVYGLSAHMLAAAAQRLAADGVGEPGVRTPVQVMGADRLRAELEAGGVTIDMFQPS
jgi:short subunit dehydrogenase-like uncharacterized protein